MSEWRRVTLGEVLVESAEKNRDGSITNILSVTEKRGIVPQTEVFKKRIATDDVTGYKTMRPYDIAWNPYLLWTGAVGQWMGEATGVTSPVYPIYRAVAGQNARYWGMVLESGFLTPYFNATAVGSITRRRRTTPAVFEQASIAVPTSTEQRRIVEVVGAVDAQIAALIAEAQCADQLWWQAARWLAESVSDASTRPLASVAAISGGLTKNKKDSSASDLVEVPYLRVANVHRRFFDLTDVTTIKTTAAKAARLKLLPGDILLNEGGDKDKLGRGSVWRNEIEDCIHQNHVFRARVTSPDVEPRFVSAWANSFGQEWFATFGTQTTGIASINKATLSRFPIPEIGLAAQRKYADALDAIWAAYEATSRELTHLRAFRATFLTALLSQSIAVPESYDTLLDADTSALEGATA